MANKKPTTVSILLVLAGVACLTTGIVFLARDSSDGSGSGGGGSSTERFSLSCFMGVCGSSAVKHAKEVQETKACNTRLQADKIRIILETTKAKILKIEVEQDKIVLENCRKSAKVAYKTPEGVTSHVGWPFNGDQPFVGVAKGSCANPSSTAFCSTCNPNGGCMSSAGSCGAEYDPSFDYSCCDNGISDCDEDWVNSPIIGCSPSKIFRHRMSMASKSVSIFATRAIITRAQMDLKKKCPKHDSPWDPLSDLVTEIEDTVDMYTSQCGVLDLSMDIAAFAFDAFYKVEILPITLPYVEPLCAYGLKSKAARVAMEQLGKLVVGGLTSTLDLPKSNAAFADAVIVDFGKVILDLSCGSGGAAVWDMLRPIVMCNLKLDDKECNKVLDIPCKP